jgi:hypothetical protein
MTSSIFTHGCIDENKSEEKSKILKIVELRKTKIRLW